VCTAAAAAATAAAAAAAAAASGAQLFFYTAFDGEAEFANGIVKLKAAGCQIIVDDIAYFAEVRSCFYVPT
jgi:hypothetical protein